MENLFSKEAKRSRGAYMIQCAFEYFVALVMTDSYLANLLSYFGMSQATIGIVTSLISLAFLFQLLSLLVVPRIRNTKKFAVAIHCTGQSFFMCLYFVPFLPMPDSLRHTIVIPCILLGYLGNYLATSVIFKWGMSFVQPDRRARFSSVKEMISLLAGTLYSLFMGFMMDRFIAEGNIKGGFLFSAVAILILNILDFTCLMLMKNEPVKEKKEKAEPFLQSLKTIWGYKSYRYVVLLAILWNISCYCSLGFLGVYKTETLLYTVGQSQLIVIVGNLCRFAVTGFFGRYSDRHGYLPGMRIALSIAAIAFALYIFTNVQTRFLIIVFTILYSVSQAGISQNMLNITFDYVRPEHFVQATAIKSSIGGVCGFLTSLAAGKLLAFIEGNGNMIFGYQVYGQQVLAIISAVFALIAILFDQFVVEKQPKWEQA